MSEAKSLSELRSLGPKSQEMLVRAGITTVAQLRAMGSVAAYARVKRVDGKASLNLLWALESAVSGEPWQQVARLHRTSLLLALDERESKT
jgi:DNA transformation protein